VLRGTVNHDMTQHVYLERVKKIIFLKRDATDFLSIRILERVLWAREKV